MKNNNFHQFTLPTRVIEGYGSLSVIPSEVENLGITKALIVSDKGIENAGLLEQIEQDLNSNNIPYAVFADTKENPDVETVNAGLDILRKKNCDGVIIVGGGSSLCAGRAIALVATNNGSIVDYCGKDKFSVAPLPVIAVPTTVGSGAEVSCNVVIENEVTKRNMTITGYRCYPEVAILDPNLVKTLPKSIAVNSALDALSHAFEALHSTNASIITDTLAYSAITIIINNITKGTLTQDLQAKSQLLIASTMANIACGNASLGLVHAMSTSMTKYKLPHGWKNGVLLPYVLEYNSSVCKNKYKKVLKELEIDYSNEELLISIIKKLYTEIDFSDRIPESTVPREAISELSKSAFNHPFSKFNIRKTSELDIKNIYEKAFSGWKPFK